MRSPICKLQDSIAAVAFKIAPEKELECENLRNKHGIEFEITDDLHFDIRVKSDEQEQKSVITLPVSALEYLWAFSFWCWVVIQEYQESQKCGHEMFDPVGNERLKTAHKLISWAKSNLMTTGTDDWPLDLPQPTEDDVDESDTAVARELFLCALGWIVHHEIGHIGLEHSPGDVAYSDQNEKAADTYATDWILDNLEAECPMLKKRSIGVAAATLCLQSFELNDQMAGCLRNTHPDAHVRLYESLTKYQVGTEEVIEAFVVVILQCLFSKTDVQFEVNGAIFSDMFNDVLYQISRRKHSLESESLKV